MNIILFSILFFFVLIGILLFIFREEIEVFFFPQNFNKILMKELDGNIKEWNERKGKDLTFTFRNGLYYMTHAKPTYMEHIKNEQPENIIS